MHDTFHNWELSRDGYTVPAAAAALGPKRDRKLLKPCISWKTSALRYGLCLQTGETGGQTREMWRPRKRRQAMRE